MPKKPDPRRINTEPRSKAFFYKRATYASEPHKPTLEESLNLMWDHTKDQSGMRKQELMADPTEKNKPCIVTHYRTIAHGMSFYEIIIFTPGTVAMAADINFAEPTISIEDVPIKNDKGKTLELIKNIAYLGVSGNHLIIIPSGELPMPIIEDHLNWLLKSASQVLVGGQSVRLSNRIPPEKEADINDASAIKFSTDLAMAPAQDLTGQAYMRPSGLSWDGLRSILSSCGKNMLDLATELETKGLTETTPIEIDILLKWHKKKRNSRHELIDRIATGLRHVDQEIDYEILTKNGSLTKNTFIIKKIKSIPCRGERPVREILWEKMALWLAELQTSGQVI